MAFIVRRPWDGQPQEAAPASSELLARKLTHLSTGDFGFDAAIQRALSVTQTSGTREVAPTPAGIGTKTYNGANSVNQAREVIASGDWTFAFIGNPPSDSFPRYAFDQRGGAGEMAFGVNFDDQFSALAGRFSVTMLQSGVNRSHAYVASAVDGTMKAFVMRNRGGTVSAWIDGVARTVVTSGNFATVAASTASDTFYCAGLSIDGGKAFGGTAGDASLVATLAAQSALSDSDCIALSRVSSFWGVAYQPRRIYVPSAAAGAFNPAWAIGSNAIIGAGAIAA